MDRTTKDSLTKVIIVLGGVFVCGCIIIAAACLLSLNIIDRSLQQVSIPPASTPAVVPTVIDPSLNGNLPSRPLENPVGQDVPAAPTDIPITIDDGSDETLKTLQGATIPSTDPVDLAARLQSGDSDHRREDFPRTLPPPAAPLQVGARELFWVSNEDTKRSFQVPAVLEYITDHVYFWIEEGVPFDKQDLAELVQTFENEIYPTNRAFFGSEWTPGVDGDPHLYILYARGAGESVAGYYSSADEYSPQVNEHSNGHEMFFLHADELQLDQEFTYSVLAHEFQHMIHWYRDRNEELWVNEGFGELAATVNGYNIGGADYTYVADPDIQLNDWPNGNEPRLPHYGASFLFLNYFLDRFGPEATQALVTDPANGLTSIDDVLSSLGLSDPSDGEAIDADDLFADWVVASFLQDDRMGDGRYTYHNYPQAPQPTETETIRTCPSEMLDRVVHQYGVDYIRIRCNGLFLASGDYTIDFSGEEQTRVLPADPFSGKYAFWSNKGDESDMALTRRFDFRDHSGPLTLSYWTWYDLENEYDYAYLLASPDGDHWEILTTPSGTSADPVGNSYGWGYTGSSQGGSVEEAKWIQENVDISRFAGQEVYLRFEYITDAAVHGEGMLLDDISVPEIGYFTDFETDEAGWESSGFVRIQNSLPQSYRVSLITKGRETHVEQFTLNGDNSLRIPVTFGEGIEEAVLAVSGTTRFTRQEAPYSIQISPIP